MVKILFDEFQRATASLNQPIRRRRCACSSWNSCTSGRPGKQGGTPYRGLRAASLFFFFVVVSGRAGGVLLRLLLRRSRGVSRAQSRGDQSERERNPWPHREGRHDNSSASPALAMPLTEHLMDQTELFDLANDAVILTDSNGAITYWNRGACRTYGWEKEEALGQNVHAFLQTELSGDGARISNRSCSAKRIGKASSFRFAGMENESASRADGLSTRKTPPRLVCRSIPTSPRGGRRKRRCARARSTIGAS